MVDTPPKFSLRLAQFLENFYDRGREMIKALRYAIGTYLCNLSPDTFIRIEFWRISRKMLQVEPGITAAEPFDGLAFVYFGVIPDNDKMVAKMPKQVTQKLAYFPLLDVLLVQVKIQAQMPADGADGKS